MSRNTIRTRLAKHSMTLANGCIEWTGARFRTGYAKLEKTGQAHRAAYIEYRGDIPSGFQLDHLCRNKACINPDHLEPVTNRENTLRGLAPNIALHKAGVCAKGHEMKGQNLYISPIGRRHCRACNREAVSRYHKRWKSKVKAVVTPP